MDSFLKKFFPSVYAKESSMTPSDNQYCKFDSQILTLFTSSLYLAALISSIGASKITRLFGRRITMLLGGILFFCGAICNAFAQNVWMLIVGRILLGFGIGCINQVHTITNSFEYIMIFETLMFFFFFKCYLKKQILFTI